MAVSSTDDTTRDDEPPHTGHQGGDFGGGSGFRRSVLLFVVVLVTVAAAYLLGRHQMGDTVRDAEAQAEALAERLEESQAAWGAARDMAQDRIALLEARRQLDLAAGELQERNFGQAQGRVTLAGLLIASTDPRALQVEHANDEHANDDAEGNGDRNGDAQAPVGEGNHGGRNLGGLAHDLQDARITVTEDVSTQRAQLQAFMVRLDRILPPPDPARLAADPSDAPDLPRLYPETLNLPGPPE